ncbi:MAG: hypothetical protein ABR974_09700 [Bacteroidales bacterium]|jgi:PBP1b-binding outer membrane lipoprotein LpoB
MRTIYLAIILLMFLVSGCNKDKASPNSGTITIDNALTGSGPYYAFGFSVKTGTKVSTLESPLDVITILEDNDVDMVVKKLFFSCENYNNSFSNYASYTDATTARTAFDNLKTFTDTTWTATGDSVVPNQIWLFRTSDLKYAKIRVISIFSEIRAAMPYPYAECTFEWVYQPDGTKIFP